MLFNSLEFIFLFLPLSWFLYLSINKRHHGAALLWLLLCSLFFYGLWHIKDLAIFLCSIIFNFMVARFLLQGEHKKTLYLAVGVSVNIGVLFYFKYAGFFSQPLTFDSPGALILPLGISFYTFQQISYLVDTFQGRGGNHPFSRYALFVSFFPQLIAGPILHHDEILPQLEDKARPVISGERLSSAVFLFSLGLFKKVVVADTLGEVVKTGFSHPEQLGLAEAWISALAFTFQLYFDFGGYSDMARGMCGFFNLDIPMNFTNPYRKKNISDFWKSWHITLTRWFEKYLYFPLALRALRISSSMFMALALNTFIFVVIGFWHGAGWPFIVFGFLHGIALSCHKLFKHFGMRFPPLLAWPMTFSFLVISWVFFRSHSLTAAFKMLRTMFGEKGSNLSTFGYQVLTDVKASAANLHILMEFRSSLSYFIAFLIIVSCLCWIFSPWSIDFDDLRAKKGTTGKIIASTLMFGTSVFLLTLGYKYEFLYFNF